MLEQFLRVWLQNLARQRIQAVARDALQRGVLDEARRAFTDGAAEGQGAGEGEAAGSPPKEPPCHVGVVFALAMESGGLEDRLSGVVSLESPGLIGHQGGLRGRGVVLVRSGAGQRAAAKATENLIAGHHPAWIISAGYAGGLDPRVKRFDVVVADRVLTTDPDRAAIPIELPAKPEGEKGIHVGPILTMDRVIARPSEKRSLGEKYGALAVEMETAAVAEVCRRESVPFLAVRVITDAMQDELPPDVDRLLKQKSTAGRLGAALGAILSRPSSALDMYQLKENALVASDRLAKFLEPLIAALAE